MKKSIKKIIFPMQMTKRVYLSMILLIMIPMILLAFVIWIGSLENEKNSRGEELYYLASQLDRSLIGTYEDILVYQKALSLPVDDQVEILHSELQPIVDTFSSFHPNMNFGFYSRKYDRILAIGPAFQRKFIEPISGSYPYSYLFDTMRPELKYEKSSVYWEGEPVLTQVYPMYRDGTLIGYTWVSLRMSEIYDKLLGKIRQVILGGLVILAMSIFICWWIFLRVNKTLTSFAEAIISNSRRDLAFALLPELNPILEMVKDRTDELIDTNTRLKRMIEVKEKTEKELLQSEERFSKAFSSSPSLMFIIDFAEGTLLDANESFLEKTGFTREEMEGRTWRELIHWTNPKAAEELEQKVLKGERVHNIEGGFYSRSGEPCYGLISIEPIMLNKRNCLLWVITDITERKHFEQELMKLDRLNLIGQMAAGISHEIRNPMTTVRGFLQMLSQKEDAQKYQDYYALMIDELDRANSIITEFLSISRNKPEEQKSKNLNTIIKTLAPLIQADGIGQEKVLELELGEIPDLCLNEKEIRQVILNLSRNGLEAMERGGRLTIKTFAKKGDVILQVRDSGTGISPELIQKVGTPFFTTKDRGTGLGLAVCYGIVSRHHAQMTIESGSWGTEFNILFPVLDKKISCHQRC